MFDLYTLLGVGIIAYVMEKLDYPNAPNILGVILRSIAESQLMLALTGGDPVALTMSRIMIAPTAFILLTPVWTWWKERGRSRDAA